MIQRIWAMIQKEFIQTMRDWRTLSIQLSLPVLQLFLFGYAISTTVDFVPTVVADQSLDPASRAYVEAMAASGYFEIVQYVASQKEVVQAIDRGEARVGIVIPPHFAANVERKEAQALLLVDGSDMFTAQSAYNAAYTVSQAHTTKLLRENIARTGRIANPEGLLPLKALVRILYNPNLDDLWFIIPSMVSMLLQTQSMTLTAAAIVREREMGTIEQLLVTPIRSGELLLGKIAPNLIIAVVNMLTIVGLGVFWFKVPFKGNFWLFFWLALLYVFSGLALGLLISTISQNQKQAQQLATLFMMVGMILGGFIFPRDAMPPFIRAVGGLFPMAYFIPIAQGIITKGVGFNFVWENTLALLVYTVIIMIIAARAFRQDLD